jgi:hypothetical protein
MPICSEQKCGQDRPLLDGLCRRCYNRRRSAGTAVGPKCSVDGCDRSRAALGYCHMHWRRARKGSPMTPERLRCRSYPVGKRCSVANCVRDVASLGFCETHWRRHRRGAPLEEPIRPFQRGEARIGKRIIRAGYALVFEPGHPNASPTTGFVFEHRKVMAECLGRPLLPHENVHHKNGNRADNRLVRGHELRCYGTCCNLELWSKRQPPGQRVEDKVAWAREILATYGG